MPKYRIGDWVEEVFDQLDGQVKALKMKTFNEAIMNTRVDTGRLRGNWQASEGKPQTGELDREDIPGTATLNDADNNTNGISPDTYFVNNLPYASKWNEVDLMIPLAVNYFNTNVRKLKKK